MVHVRITWKLSFVIAFFVMAAACNSSSFFTLIIPLYNEKNPLRAQEYLTCLERNLKHQCIGQIHVIYDTSLDDDSNLLLAFLKTKNLSIGFVEGRPTYEYCFTLANEMYPNARIIISNADIYFNETLDLLCDYDLTNKFLAITRWNGVEDGTIKPFLRPNGEPKTYSQDTWIFKTPLKKFKHASIELGTPWCDGKISLQAYIEGLHVLNPCLTIQCCHLHNSNVRHYRPGVYSPADNLFPPWVTLY